jgi:hypothetical protein
MALIDFELQNVDKPCARVYNEQDDGHGNIAGATTRLDIEHENDIDGADGSNDFRCGFG